MKGPSRVSSATRVLWGAVTWHAPPGVSLEHPWGWCPLACPLQSRSLGYPCGGGGISAPGTPRTISVPQDSSGAGGPLGVPVSAGPRGSLGGEGPRAMLRVTVPGAPLSVRGILGAEVPHVPRGWEVPGTPVGGDVPRHLRSPPRCPGSDPAAFPKQERAQCLSRGKPGAASACSSLLPPTRRVCRTLPAGPKPTAEHPKAEFEKCSSVLSRAAAVPSALEAMLCCITQTLAPPRCSESIFDAGQHSPEAEPSFAQGKPEPGRGAESAAHLDPNLPKINTRGVY